jgi:hypothetical protein
MDAKNGSGPANEAMETIFPAKTAEPRAALKQIVVTLRRFQIFSPRNTPFALGTAAVMNGAPGLQVGAHLKDIKLKRVSVFEFQIKSLQNVHVATGHARKKTLAN